MILVRSHLQRLSGSRAIAHLLILMVIVLVSCSPKVRDGKKQTTLEPNKPQMLNKSGRSDTTRVPTDNIPKINAKTDVPFAISLLLALHLDSVSADEMYDLKRSRETNISLDFYQGLLFAFDSLAKDELRLNLTVFDTKNDSNEVKKIFVKSEVLNSDLIIGPIFNDELLPAIQFAKSKQKFVLSPLAPSTSSAFNNPYFISANAPIELHGKKQAEYIQNTFDAKNVIVITGKSIAEQRYISAFESTLKNSSKKISVGKVGSSNADLQTIDLQLKKDEKNIIFIASSSPSTLTRVFQKLKYLTNKYEIVVFAHPLVPKMESLNFELLLPLNVHTTSADYIEDDKLIESLFYSEYRKKYKTEPSEFAMNGFDLGMLIGKSISKNGKDISKIINPNPFNGLSGVIDFQQVEGWGVQNTWLQIVKFRNYKFEAE